MQEEASKLKIEKKCKNCRVLLLFHFDNCCRNLCKTLCIILLAGLCTTNSYNALRKEK